MIYVYRVGERTIAVAADSSTIANHGLNQKFANLQKRYLYRIDELIQVNGNLTIDQQLTEIQQTD
jgi:hypothetical protein